MNRFATRRLTRALTIPAFLTLPGTLAGQQVGGVELMELTIAEAHEAAQQLVNDSAERTQQLVDDMWARAQNDVESMKAQAVADIQAEVAAQAVGAAEEVVRSSLDASGQNDLIESYISGLGASS